MASTITKRNVLAVEGEDERSFFAKLLADLSLLDVQIECVGGKNQFPAKLPALLRVPGFMSVERLAIVRDRDEDEAFISIANIVKRAGLLAPSAPGTFSDDHPLVGVFIMPGSGVEGTMLEDLCLETVRNHPAMRCVESFAECVQDLPDPPHNASKAKCQAFLAAQAEIVNSVGVGAQKGYWGLTSPVLNELKAFLAHMR